MVDFLMAYTPTLFGSTATVSASSSQYQNGSGSTLAQGTPVSVNGSGQIIPTNVTSQSSVEAFVGYVSTSIAISAVGTVISNGRLQNLTGYSFTIGQAIYIGIGGILQNTQPTYGVTGFNTGDSVVFCGVVVKNTTNPSNQDLQILTQVIGVL